MIELGLLIVVCLASVLLGLLVWANNPRAIVNRVFAAFNIWLAAWSVVAFYEDTGLSEPITRLLVQSDFALSSLMILFFFLFCYHIARSRARYVRAVAIVLAAANIVLPYLGQTVAVELVADQVKFIEQPGYFAFVILMVYGLLGGVFILLRRYRQSEARQKAQLRFVLLGLVLMAVILIVTNVVLPNFMTVAPVITRLGIYSILFFTGLSSYAIAKHRLMDVRLIVARSVAYILLLATLAGLYGGAVFGITSYVFPEAQASAGQNVTYIGLAIILAFTFQPLRKFFDRLTARVFYRDAYDAQEVLNKIGKVLASELLLEKLLHNSLQQICLSLGIESGQFMVFDNGQVYKLAHYGPLPNKLLTAPTAQKLRQGVLVADELVTGERKQIMADHGIRISLMLRTRDEFVGFLLLGDKLSGNIYGEQDIRLLEILAGEISIAISNAKAYEDIAEFNRTLQTKVEQATAKLRQANAHLQELDKVKDDFISMAAHQLRTPLTTIKGYLSMLLEGDTGKLAAEQQEFAGYAFDGAERMVALVSDLLNVSRMSSGKFMIERQPTDVVAMISDEVRQLERHAAAKGLKLIFSPPKKAIPSIQLDEGKTRQVVMNFIDNAIYYTKTGSVRVEIGVEKNRLKVTVTDTGIGVPDAAKAKLFTKFFRADNAQQERADGTGLGLYLAKRVIEDQGGTIIFESTEGRGSTFGFELPLTPPQEKPNEPNHQSV